MENITLFDNKDISKNEISTNTELKKLRKILNKRLYCLAVDNQIAGLQHLEIKLTLAENYLESEVYLQKEDDLLQCSFDELLNCVMQIEFLVFVHWTVGLQSINFKSNIIHFNLILGYYDLANKPESIMSYLIKGFSNLDYICHIKPLKNVIDIQKAYIFLFKNYSYSYRNHKIYIFSKENCGYPDFLS